MTVKKFLGCMEGVLRDCKVYYTDRDRDYIRLIRMKVDMLEDLSELSTGFENWGTTVFQLG